MHIRPAEPREAAALSTLAQESKAHWGYAPEQLELWRPELTLSAATLTSCPTVVAEVDGRIAGFYSLDPSPAVWSLAHLWISPRHMRQGIGRALLEHARQQAAAGGSPGLAIDADPYAEPFYLACGARRVGRLPAPIAGEPERFLPQLYLAAASGGDGDPP